jgi:hypothetical protein
MSDVLRKVPGIRCQPVQLKGRYNTHAALITVLMAARSKRWARIESFFEEWIFSHDLSPQEGKKQKGHNAQ